MLAVGDGGWGWRIKWRGAMGGRGLQASAARGDSWGGDGYLRGTAQKVGKSGRAGSGVDDSSPWSEEGARGFLPRIWPLQPLLCRPLPEEWRRGREAGAKVQCGGDRCSLRGVLPAQGAPARSPSSSLRTSPPPPRVQRQELSGRAGQSWEDPGRPGELRRRPAPAPPPPGSRPREAAAPALRPLAGARRLSLLAGPAIRRRSATHPSACQPRGPRSLARAGGSCGPGAGPGPHHAGRALAPRAGVQGGCPGAEPPSWSR